MWYIVLAILAISLILNGALLYVIKKRKEQLSYITDELENNILGGKVKKVLLSTSNDSVQRLLNVLNRNLEAEQRAISKYAQTEEAMKKMLSNISHDLKTPLTVVLGYMESVMGNPKMGTDERERLLGKVNGKVNELIELITKFFNLAKLESGDMEIPLEAISLNELCRTNIFFFYERIESEGLQVELQIPETPVYAIGNKDAVNRVLHNLLSNAIQFGKEGGVVGLSLSTKKTAVIVEVWDRGKGIEEQVQDRVFERLFTLEDSRNKLYQGSGIGLSITKRLVEAMDGKITLESTPYIKTVFQIQLKRTSK